MNYLSLQTPSEMAGAASLKNESFMHKARNSVKCSHSVMSPYTYLRVGQISVSFKGQTQVIQAELNYSVLIAYCGGTCEDRVPALVIFGPARGSVSRGARHRGSSSGTRSRHSGGSSGTSLWNTCSNCLPQPDYQSIADYVMQIMGDGFHISPSQASHSFAFIIPL